MQIIPLHKTRYKPEKFTSTNTLYYDIQHNNLLENYPMYAIDYSIQISSDVIIKAGMFKFYGVQKQLFIELYNKLPLDKKNGVIFRAASGSNEFSIIPILASEFIDRYKDNYLNVRLIRVENEVLATQTSP